NFSVVPKTGQIRFGLSAIKNVGENIAGVIIDERKANGPYSSIQDFVLRVNSRDLNKKSLESMIRAGAFDKMAERNQCLINLEHLLEWSKETQREKINGQKGLFDGMDVGPKFELQKAEPATMQEKLNWEKELLGLYISGHPLQNFKKILEQKAISINSLINFESPKFPAKTSVRIGGIISGIKKIITKRGLPMLFMKVEDMNSKVEVVVFPSLIERNPVIFQENKVVFVTGRLDQKDNVPKIICEQIEEILEA
ncbi:MAG: OB-fold nucleic acid binding domain-containing protein, partial [Candidatus Parcubacteria bacterium]|nr:OB-fold nucleic acid binding domain-containing protein [Candidatus Parcubacteria bacterium]